MAIGNAKAGDFNPHDLALLDRLTWGVNTSSAEHMRSVGVERWLEEQLHPPAAGALPGAVKAQIEAMPDVHKFPFDIAVAFEAQAKSANQVVDPDQKKAAQQVYQGAMNERARQAAARTILRALYVPDQLRERMTWFWFNHFNVHQYKGNIRILVGDYEDHAIRAHALGKFRDLLSATLRHPAMLRYLDNADNAAGHINENYAREIMELHTMGVGSGYTQADVEALAKILTGVGIDLRPEDPKIKPELQSQLFRDGAFEFNPMRHDYSDKVFLGHTIKGRGLAEVDEALDLLVHHPATATHLSRQIAIYFVSDNPPETLVQKMAQTFKTSDGDIATVLSTMIHAPEFAASLKPGSRFKDPAEYVLSAVRLAYDDKVVLNTLPIQSWLNRMGEGLFNHETPDGYSMASASWNGPGQMMVRFEIARAIGSGSGRPVQAECAERDRPAGISADRERALLRRTETDAWTNDARSARQGGLAAGLEHAVPVVAGIHALNLEEDRIMNRRDLIKAFAAMAPLTVAGRVWAAPSTDARLLVVFLRGAYDAANVLVPVSSDFYYHSRPTLGIARPDVGNPNAALSLTSEWGLHPALRDSVFPLWGKREIAFVPFAGTSDDLTRSHFETQDTIELGQSAGRARDYRSGFMSRLAGELTRVKPIAFTDQLPLIFRGKTQIPNNSINNVGKPGVDDRQAQLIRQMYAQSNLAASVSEGFQVRDDVYRSISQEMMAANRGAVSPRGFELSARRIGRLMREQFNLGFVDVGGWDTHVNQGAANGYLADRLGELGRALAGFSEEVGPAAWRDTVVVVISEFGRTFRENGDRGTDHGHGSVYWVLGGGINGGRILGQQIKVEQATLFQNRDYPVLTDYRAMFAGLFARMYGLDAPALQRIFAGVHPAELGLV